jgi:hypothetical protein
MGLEGLVEVKRVNGHRLRGRGSEKTGMVVFSSLSYWAL